MWGLGIFSTLILAPSLVAVWALPDPFNELLANVAFSVALWVFWLALWPQPAIACLVVTPLVLLVPIMIFLACSYQTHINPAVLGIVFETNVEESREYLQALWPKIALAYSLLLGALAASLWLIKGGKIYWQRRWRLCALLGVPLIFVALHLTYQPLEAAASGLRPRQDFYRIDPWPLELESIRNTSPFGMALQVVDAAQAEKKILLAYRKVDGFKFGANQSPPIDAKQVFVLVIGESARKDRWSLYGYPHETSPRLQRERDLIVFDDVTTLATVTRNAVPAILARGVTEKSLVTAFRESGFATYWLSTQAPVGAYDASYAGYAKEADHRLYFNPTGGWFVTPPDAVMLPSLRKILADDTESRQFLVIHTLGSHLEYRYRYPREFDVFKPSLDPGELANEHDAASLIKLNNTYDNSILYTDYFLDQVISALKSSGRPIAGLIYLSDHGEDLFDDGCSNYGHGRPTVAGTRIPFFVWLSPAYQGDFTAKTAALREHRHEPVTSEVVFPTLLDIAGLRFPTEDLTHSAASPSFTRHGPRIVQSLAGALDLDKAHPDKQCLLVD